MIYGIWQSAAGMQIQQYRQALIANNIANADTPGYKPDVVAVVERPVAALSARDPKAAHGLLDRLGGGLFETPVHTDFSPGPLSPSANPLDLAILGDGFLRVGAPDGPRLTRDGRLTIRDDGAIVTVAGGLPVLDTAGRPLRADPASTDPVQVDSAGNVRQGPARLGRLALVDVDDRTALTKAGGNLFDPGEARLRPAAGELRAFTIEESAANPVTGLVQMIAAARAYEMNATLISLQDHTLGRVVNDVGRVG